MWPSIWKGGVCLDEALHLDDSRASLLDMAFYLDEAALSRCI